MAPVPTGGGRSRARSRLRRVWGQETPTQSAAGVLVGLLLWGWVLLPLVRGGPDEVRRLLLAKFVNRDPEGRWLP